MGFKSRKHYRLTFAEPEYGGLEVTMRRPTIGDLLDLQEMGVSPTMTPKAAAGLPKEMVQEIFGTFARFLVAWNVEDDDGTPVPPTFGGVLTQEPDFIFMILANWQKHVVSVPPPLPGGSGNGATPPGTPPPEMAIPMTSLEPDTPATPEMAVAAGSPGSS